jgi:transposase
LIGRETRVLLRHYLEQGIPKAVLAEQLGVSRRTIHHWITTGQLDRDLDKEIVYTPRPPVAAKLDPYKAIVQTRLEAYPELSGVRLLEEIRAAGYTGSYTQLKAFLRSVRPQPTPEPVIRFETPPGRQAQVDFARFQFPWGVRYALMVVLGYSRLLWLRFYARQDMHTLFGGLEEAFAFFGGVTHELLFDQMKAVITKDLRLLGGQLVLNLEFLRFARHWEFTPRACRPYRAQTKGKVERPISYVRDNFVYGREFLGDGDLDEQRLRWLEQRANVRTHQTIKEQPIVRFEREERLLLKPLAERAYQSLVLVEPKKKPASKPDGTPRIEVERRPLAMYARIAGGAR